ncbi:MAG: hypothetical protein ACRD0J_18980 [Acidimicrobiales bacterium]
MAVNEDCRHYVMRTVGTAADKVERCRVDANRDVPFACPDDCLFYERRGVSDAGWTRPPRPRPGGG